MLKPLEGIRILEWGIYYAGPGATAILSDMGADVIKIEKPVSGDPFRQFNLRGLEIEGATDIVFQAANRGKKSITIDLEQPDGRKIAYDLVAKSDIFFTNVRGSTIGKTQMDYATLSKINPKLIYARVNAYGLRGPDADRGGFDPQGQARAGMMYSTTANDPMLIKFGIVDHSTAVMASYQMMAALLMRERFGIGQEVDVSLLGSVSYLMYIGNLQYLADSQHDFARERQNPLRNQYQCQDGKWLILRMRDKDWPKVCRILGLQGLDSDQRFNGSDKEHANSGDLVATLKQAFAGKPRNEWLRLFNDKDLVISAVNSQEDALNDPQMIANEYVVDYQHEDKGKIRIPMFPIHFSKAEIARTMVSPKLGEHTTGVLRDILSYPQEEIDRLKAKKII